MQNPYSTPKSNLAPDRQDVDLSQTNISVTMIVYLGIFGGVLFYAGFILFQTDPSAMSFDWNQLEVVQDILFPMLAIGGSFIVSALASKPMISNIKKSGTPTVQEVLGLYQTQCVIGWACLEGASFFSIFRFSQTHNLVNLIVAVVLFFLMGTQYPSRRRLQAWWERNQPLEFPQRS